MLSKPVHEQQTGKDVSNYIDMAHNLNVFAVCMGEFAAIFKINVTDGKLEQLQKF